jgi:hypothetical protein
MKTKGLHIEVAAKAGMYMKRKVVIPINRNVTENTGGYRVD